MNMIGQLHALATSTSGEEHSVPTEWLAMWAWDKAKRRIFALASNQILVFLSIVWSLYWLSSINLLNPTGHVMHQQFNIQQLYVLPTLYLCVLYLSEKNSNLCHLQHKLIGFYNRDEKCLLHGMNWVFKWNSQHFIFNLLKPTGYVMHQQFNIQQLYVLPTLYLCVLYLSENKQQLVPLTA